MRELAEQATPEGRQEGTPVGMTYDPENPAVKALIDRHGLEEAEKMMGRHEGTTNVKPIGEFIRDRERGEQSRIQPKTFIAPHRYSYGHNTPQD